MHNYIAHIVCCASFTSIRLLAINKLWIDGYNKPILIYAHSAVYKPKNLKLLYTTKAQKDHSRFEIQYPKYLDIEIRIWNIEIQDSKFNI
jgi:hypothetical protein